MKALIILSIILPLIICQPLDGGYTMIKYDPTDMTQAIVLQKSQESIESQLTLSSSNFKFVKVIKVETQVVEGVNYRMTLLYQNAEQKKKIVQTVVWTQTWENTYQVTSVTDISAKLPKLDNYGIPKLPTAENAPSFETLQKTKTFQAAVQAIQEKYTQELTGYTVTKGELVSTQVVAGMMYTYRIVFTSDAGIPYEFQAQVWSKPWENFIQVVQIIPGNRIRRNLEGGWTKQEKFPSTPEDALALNAINEYKNKQQDQLGLTEYKIAKFANVETQIVSGVNYKVDIVYSNAQNDLKYVEAIVWVQAWLDKAVVTSYQTVESFIQ